MNLKVLSIVMGLLLSLCGYRATAKSSNRMSNGKPNGSVRGLPGAAEHLA